MIRFKKYVVAGFSSLLLATSMSALAAPYFTNKEGNVVWDKATGLIWQRCNLGQEWDGTNCKNNSKWYGIGDPYLSKVMADISSLNANGGFGGFDDWRIPSARELISLRECSKGYSEETVDLEDGEGPVPTQCQKNSKVAIDEIAFPQPKGKWTSGESHNATREYWTSTKSSRAHGRRTVEFHDPSNNDGGYISVNHLGSYQVKMVREVNILSNEELDFTVNLQDKRQSQERASKVQREVEVAKAKAVQEAANRESQAAENKRRADRSQAIKQLIALGPRSLYIEAGKAQRNGSITFVNTNFGAGELYEMIVDKFPDSDFAVKATDQLTAMGRTSRAESAARDSDFSARQRAYESCKIETTSCFSRTNGKGNCYRDCDRLR